MTIRLKITHDQIDNDRSVRIIAHDGQDNGFVAGELHPGQSGEFHVHLGQFLVIEEIHPDEMSAPVEPVDVPPAAPAEQDGEFPISSTAPAGVPVIEVQPAPADAFVPVAPVTEEVAADAVPEAPPVDNEHVADGATPFDVPAESVAVENVDAVIAEMATAE